MNKFLRLSILFLGMTLSVPAVWAAGEEGGGTTMFQVPPTSDEILDALGEQPKIKTRPVKTRSIVLNDETTANPAKASRHAAGQPGKNKVAFPLTFKKGSATLSAEAKRYVDGMATALQKKPELMLHISGHTDSSGGEGINRPLSLQRAEAVKDCLMTEHGIDPSRLTVSGEGSQQLLLKDNPTAAANRRVEFARSN